MSTLIIGKDAPLEDTLSRFKGIAQNLGLDLKENNWLNPLPGLWSVELSDSRLPKQVYSNGKGASKLAALCSAYGEMLERLSNHAFFSDYFLGLNNSLEPCVHYSDEKWTPLPKPDENGDLPEGALEIPNGTLNASLRKFYTENFELQLDALVDLGSSSYSRGVCSLPFTNARNGELVYFPINLLDNLYGSNGMSAGNTQYEALVQALSEIIERYVKREIIKKGLSLPEIPEQILKLNETSWDTLQGLQGPSLKVKCYDASLGGRFPVICAVMFNQSNGTCAAAFGAHPMFAVALERTLTELMQGRTFTDLDNFDEPSFDLELTGDPTNLESQFIDSTGLLPLQMFKDRPDFKFVHWDFDGSTHDQYKALRYMIDKLGFDIYVRSCHGLGVPAYRVIVPGMSEVYPLDDLIYNNLSENADFQEALLALPGSHESPETYQGYLEELDNSAQFSDDELLAPALGILPDEDSPWAQLRVGELKCLLALCAKDFDLALEYAKWTCSFNEHEFKLKRLNFYRCLVRALELKLEAHLNEDDYRGTLSLIYGEKTAQSVLDHLEGRAQFNGLESSDLNLKGFETHQALIALFAKIKETELEAAAKAKQAAEN